MKKRAWIYVLSCMLALIIGIVGGVSYSNHRFHQKQLNRFENYTLSAFSNALVKAQNDMKESTANPSTPLEKAYQNNLKVDVGQLSALWSAMYPDLIAQGVPSEKVQQIGSGLEIVYNNILPPNGADPASVKRAREWISTFYTCMYPNHGPVSSNSILLSRLKSNIPIITSKYKSYKSDGNFQVQSLFPGTS